MAIILLQTHEQIPRYCTCTDEQAHVHVDKYRSICLLAWRTNTHIMLVHRAHICTLLLRIDRHIHPHVI